MEVLKVFNIGDTIQSNGKIKYTYIVILSSDNYIRLKDINNGIICCNFKTLELLNDYTKNWKKLK